MGKIEQSEGVEKVEESYENLRKMGQFESSEEVRTLEMLRQNAIGNLSILRGLKKLRKIEGNLRKFEGI